MKDGRSRISRPDALFHSSHLGPEFRVLRLLMSVPNRVWDSMGSPCLTYLASNSSSGGPRCFYHSQPCIYVCWVAPSRCPLNHTGPVGQCSCWSKALRSAGCLPALQISFQPDGKRKRPIRETTDS